MKKWWLEGRRKAFKYPPPAWLPGMFAYFNGNYVKGKRNGQWQVIAPFAVNLKGEGITG